MTPPWLTLIGLNEDGALPQGADPLLRAATLVMGGHRHLALAAAHVQGRAAPWPNPIEAAIPTLLAHRPGPAAVLASGDPMWFGIGSMLLRHLPLAELRILPAPSSFQLAAARLGWALQDVACLSCCGRPIEALIPHLQPGARLMVLSATADTPQAVATLLAARGLGASTLHLLEALGGPAERITAHRSDAPLPQAHPLNLVAIEVAGPSAATLPLTPGLPDTWFEHDGQITKAEIRALTLAALAPRRGEHLWDIGLGAGSISIEWMLRHPDNRATGLERDPARAARARRNALALGTPGLAIVAGEAPHALAGLHPPDAVFLGAAAHTPGTIGAAWSALRPGGRLVANAIALPTERALLEAQSRLGGSLTRIAIERLDAVGTLPAYRPAMTVTQWRVEKPE